MRVIPKSRGLTVLLGTLGIIAVVALYVLWPSSDPARENAAAPATQPTASATVEAEPTGSEPTEPDTADATDPAPPVATAVEPATRLPDNPGLVEASNWVGRIAMDADSVELVWSAVDGADVYRLYRQPTADADYDAISAGDVAGAELVYEGTATDWIDASAPSLQFLTYVLVAQVGQDLTEPRWTEALTVVDTEPPSAITDLVAESTADGVLLQWAPSSDNVEFASYSVSLRDGDELVYLGGGADESLTMFLDTDTTPGTRTYEVVAVDFHDNRSAPATIEVTR